MSKQVESMSLVGRLQAACDSGVSIMAISRASGVSRYRIQVLVNEYAGRRAKFTTEEVEQLERALDSIKASF